MKKTHYLTLALLFGLVSPMAAHATALMLFGMPLKGATRTELRATLQKAGLQPDRVSDRYFCDEYGVNGQIKGANKLTVCYTDDNNTFAEATYRFPAFMDTGLVKRVVDMVDTKYGAPSSVQGMYDLGNVTVRWYRPQDMMVEVSRGWPDTTTYLTLEDRANDAKMHAQMQRDKAQSERTQAEKDSNAF